MAGAVLFFWGRSMVNSFSKVSGGNIKPLEMITLAPEIMEARELTPTMTPFVLEGSQKVTETLIPHYVVMVTPTPNGTIVGSPDGLNQDSTAWYQNLLIPYISGLAKVPDREPDQVGLFAKLSYYWPPYAYAYSDNPEYLINCDVIDGVPECEHMASGELVVDHIGEAIACPGDFPFGTVIEIVDWNEYYTCRDRGGAISWVDEGTFWIDILFPYMPNNATWGQLEEVKIWLPEG